MPPATIDGEVTDFRRRRQDLRLRRSHGPSAHHRLCRRLAFREHWLTALHALGRQHRLKVTTHSKMGCP